MHCNWCETRSIVLFLTLAVIIPRICSAHTPHDTIDALVINDSGTKDRNSALFLVRAGRHLMRSYDGGASWKELVNGIDARYSITSLALASGIGTAKTLYMATDGDGIYVSRDTGSSWSKANTGLDTLRIQHLAVAPDYDKSPLVFAAAQGGLFRKFGDRHDWQRTLDSEVEITAIAFDRYEDGLRILVGDANGNVQVSTDKGKSWKKLVSLIDAGAINSIASSNVVGTNPLIFLGTENMAVLRSANGGLSFEESGDWNFDNHVVFLVISPDYKRDTTLYASTWHEALLKSVDGGSTWQKYDSGLSVHPQADLPAFYSPYFRQISIDEARGAIYLAGFDGLFKSADNGHKWQHVETEPIGNIWSLSLSPAVDSDFVVAATTFDAGVYMARNSDLDWSINNHGLISTRLRKLAFSPNFADDDTVLSTEDEGDNLLRSTNGGKYWNMVNLRLSWYAYWKRKILGALRYRGVPASFTTDLLTKEETRAANPKGLALSPNFKSDRYLYVGTRHKGSYESTDAGRSLELAEKPPFKIWNLAMSPDFPSDKTLFASSRELGVYKSIDSGNTWRSANKGLDFLEVWQKQVAEDKPHISTELSRSKYYDILLAISPNYRIDKTLFAAGGEGVFKSTDGGESWKQKGQSSLLGHYVFAIAVSPNYEFDKTVVVSVKGKGLFRSTDGGETFSAFGRRLIENNHEMRHIAFSPLYATDKTLYTVSLEDIFRSIDDGENWQLVERPIRVENHKYDVISYQGEWEKVQNTGFSARWASRSRSKDSSVSFAFVGTGVKWIGAKSPDLGQAEVYLDGKRTAIVDQRSKSVANSVSVYSIDGLPYKRHNVMIKPLLRDHVDVADNGIFIDAFDVMGNRQASK